MRRGNPWYREPWPWLLMLGPALVIAAGAVTVWLAVASSDGLVADDYYKQGLAINQTLARSDLARALALSAIVRVDAEHVTVKLSARDASAMPDRLRITFAHPTRGGHDRMTELKALSGAYQGVAPVLAPGRWHILLEDGGGTWRLAGAIRLPDEPEIELHGNP
jgi:hypothetical protein